MARRGFAAKLQVVAAGSTASTSVTTASVVETGDLSVDLSPSVIQCSYRGCNTKTAIVGLSSCTISGSLGSSAPALTTMRTAHQSASDVYVKFTFADGTSVAGQFAITKLTTDEPVDGEERWDFEIQPSALATPDSNGNVITYAAAPTSST